MSDDLEEAFRALDADSETFNVRGPSLSFIFQHERDPRFISGGDWWVVLREMPDDLREAVLHLCEVLGPYGPYGRSPRDGT